MPEILATTLATRKDSGANVTSFSNPKLSKTKTTQGKLE
jgi:hypothetical protein